MKQNLPPARVARLIGFFVPAVTLCLSACATLPRHASTDAPISINPTAKSVAQLNINVASANELEKLPGVGRVIAERIIAHRAKYGPFRRAEHLMMVHGISERKFREIRSMVVVE